MNKHTFEGPEATGDQASNSPAPSAGPSPSGNAGNLPAGNIPARLAKLPVAVAGTWDAARRWRDGATTMERGKLYCQVRLGLELMALKETLGVNHGGQPGVRGSTSQIGKSIKSEAETWVDLLEARLGLSHSTAYRLMAMAEAAMPRLRKVPELADYDPTASAPSSQTEAVATALDTTVRKLTDGHTQASFFEELGLSKIPKGAKGGRRPGDGGRPPSAGPDAELAAMREDARLNIESIATNLSTLRSKFILLDDLDVTAFQGALERHLKAVRLWLSKPAAARTAEDAERVKALFVA